MKRFLAISLLATTMLSARAQGPAPLYENFGFVTTPPMISARAFVNFGTFNFFTVLYPFETYDTLSYTNFGTLLCANGFRFENTDNASGTRKMASDFVNFNPGVVQAVDPFPPIAFGLPCFPTLVDPSYLIIAATNIVTGAGTPSLGAALTVGAFGDMRLLGHNVDLSSSGLMVNPVWNEANGTATTIDRTQFQPDIAVSDIYWEQNVFTQVDPLGTAGIWNGLLASATDPIEPAFNFTLFNPEADSYVIPVDFGRTFLTNYTGSATNVTGTNLIPVILASNIFKGAAFCSAPPEFFVDIGFVNGDEAFNPFQIAGFTLTTLISNAVTGQLEPASIHVNDTLAAQRRFRGLSLNVVGCTAQTARPMNFLVDRLPFAPGNNGNNGYPDARFFVSTGAGLGNTNVSRDTVTNAVVTAADFASYLPFYDNIVSRPPAVTGGTETNYPGRVRIIADEINLQDTRLRAEGQIYVKAGSVVSSSRAVFDCENLLLDLSAEDGNLKVENFAPANVQRMRGPLRVWSVVWTNTAIVVFTNNYAFTNVPIFSPPGSTNIIGTNVWALPEPVTNQATLFMTATLLDATAVQTILPVNVYALDSHSANTVVNDDMTIIRSMQIEGRSLTLNGDITLAGFYPPDPVTGLAPPPGTGLQNWSAVNAPNLQFFTNNGVFSLYNQAHFGDDRAAAYSVFLNTGTISAASIGVLSSYFENRGNLSSAGPIFLRGTTGLLQNGASSAETTTRLLAGNLKLDHYSVISGGAITFNVTNSLTDAGAGSANVIRAEDGFRLDLKPRSGDLLGTVFTTVAPAGLSVTVQHFWAAEDRGLSAAGFIDNAAIGTLLPLTFSARPTFVFSGRATDPSGHYGLYVDLLDLSALTNLTQQLVISPNLTIYYAAARLSSPPPLNGGGIEQTPEEFLDGQFNGRLRWVPTYAGPNSSQPVLVNGQTYQINRALANSKIIDSDGDTIPNFYDINNGYNFVAATVQVVGNGSVSPNYQGQALIVGQTYSMIATPLDGAVFVGWSGSFNLASPQITFTMVSNLSLTATFTFAPLAATYNGLFYQPSGVEFLKSGSFSATTTTGGSYSGKLQLGKQRLSFKGQLAADGTATNNITPSTGPALTLRLQAGADQLIGTVTDGTWTANAVAGRAAFKSGSNPAGFAGKYTVSLPGSGDATNTLVPLGDGYGTASVDASGKIKFSGSLADGTKVSQSTTATALRQWPLFVSLYSGKGQVLGWLTFAAEGDRDVGGEVSWIKLPGAASVYYSGGFDADLFAIGSKFNSQVRPTTGFLAGELQLTGGNLADPVESEFTINVNNKVTNLGGSSMSLKVNANSGVITGSVKDPATGRSLKVNGVMLQKQGYGSGYFLGTDQSGHLLLAP